MSQNAVPAAARLVCLVLMAFFADNALQGRGGYSWGGQAPELVIQRSLTKTYQALGYEHG